MLRFSYSNIVNIFQSANTFLSFPVSSPAVEKRTEATRRFKNVYLCRISSDMRP